MPLIPSLPPTQLSMALLLGAACAMAYGVAYGNETAQISRIDPDSGAETWETQAHGVALRLTQLLPDQVRAFYLSRGFPAGAVEPYATACVFMTVLRNDAAPGELNYRLADWEVRGGGPSGAPTPTEAWMARWQRMGLAEPARIAFRWAQFPTEQEYAPGEWNQGMLAVGQPPGATFDLIARWNVAGKTYEGTLKNARCAR